MKKSLFAVCTAVALLALFAGASLAAATIPNFSGKWTWKNEAGDTFTINLTQKNDIIKGSHEATAENGTKVDSSNGEISIYGKYVDGAFLVEFRSFVSDTKGRAMMRLEDKGKSLLWQLVNYPEGEYYIPQGNVYMKKVAK